jgi:hypothetical protein
MKRLGNALIAGGAAVWTVGVVAWISGVWVTLPPDAVRVLVLSLVAVSGGSLVAAGALVGRSHRVHMVPQPPIAQDKSASTPQLTEAAVSTPDLLPRAAGQDDRVSPNVR